jgi:hypothetical protein
MAQAGKTQGSRASGGAAPGDGRESLGYVLSGTARGLSNEKEDFKDRSIRKAGMQEKGASHKKGMAPFRAVKLDVGKY